MQLKLIIISLSFATTNSSLAQAWIDQTSGTTKTLMGVSFTDADHGIVVGEGSTILRTTNGGEDWV